MTLEEQKEKSLGFLKSIQTGNPKIIGEFIADNFEFEMMGRLPGVAPIRGKAAYLEQISATIKVMFSSVLTMKFHTVIAEGPHVAIQAESTGVAGNGKK